ncbi:hypothetical protein LTR10_022336 [Elasticomyces elasticus]|uniref:DUF2235 domain-containing protein n=1 Tax=Exophiala sideris TaxID=1016849 RepID=A0ABR0J456_9EURO|nr:hypothetical protein LTR10_022336 [Elasticomyces elasticus]KAK5026877.1 hypothetical protein LTS07_007175 [Exophiala sideris]KAK5033881.1 hypothetical protein LTR13_006480 [Exophiala sideris]KAK5055844.1 hypothetical protein LTR69_008220 [Exophiala sideris]KAK5180823.1 hypothetical protein LTR44_006642 [Eurotiomycetes sp. CCFEE 6388]
MSERTHVKRLIVCVDAEESEKDGSPEGETNHSSIFRLKGVVSDGICYDRQGQLVEQVVRYYRAVRDGPKLLDRLKTLAPPYFEQQIHDIVKEVCEVLEEPRDELFLYGAGRGAFIVRAVAGILDILHLPKRTSVRYFDKLYQSCLDVYKARHEDDNRNGPKIMEFLRSHTTLPVQIRFLGVFDTVKYTAEGHKHDLSLVNSIQHTRHALALNESRSQLSPEFIEIPKNPAELQGRSFVQAWFIGSHIDIGGGTGHDGLALYPLQWILVESIRAGLVTQRNEKETLMNKGNVLSLVFPQYSGDIPKLGGDDEAEWHVKHNNGIEVSLFDLQMVHGGSAEEDHVHGIKINPSNVLYNSHRKVFESKSGLVGYCANESYGTIIHPSVFCLLDRYPRFYEQSRFKWLKKSLANYRDRNVQDPEGGIPPWLEGMQLQASGVKAFRILVCGKTGVGKSTLINKVFGVELTEESRSYSQGDHDINQAFESPNHPGLLIHDSRGWQAGSENELDLIARFLRHRAYQKDPGEALHVIWFCVDSDVSRIEEADKRTFDTIAQYSCNVPVFVVGTKKDKLIAFRKIQLLEKFMEENGNYSESSRLANEEANRLADEQFMALRDELSRIKHYKADGFCCLSKDDTQGIRKLLHSTLELIVDDRVRVFAVAAQVVDVEQKIDSALTECMRLATHAVRTAMVPLPMSGLIGTPTVARILCEHVLQCFGFPKVLPDAVEEIMTRVVFLHLKAFMMVTLIEFLAIGTVTAGLIVATMGIGGLLGLASCILAAQPTARMLFKCACDMILILERSFRYRGKYVSVKQIEDAATYYTTAMTTTFSGKEMLRQKHVHEEVDRLIPLSKVFSGVRLGRLRPGLEDIIYKNRFQKRDSMQPDLTPLSLEIGGREILELDGGSRSVAYQVELPAEKSATALELPAEVPAGATLPLGSSEKEAGVQLSGTSDTTTTIDDLLSWDETTSMTQTISDQAESGAADQSSLVKDVGIERVKTDNFLSRGMKAMGTKKMSSRFGLKKSKTNNS